MNFHDIKNMAAIYHSLNEHITDPEEAYFIAIKYQHARSKILEHTITNSAEYSYYYAKNILKEKWPAGEHSIVNNDDYAYLYARYVLKKRWPLAEVVMKRNSGGYRDYAIYFKLEEANMDNDNQLNRTYNSSTKPGYEELEDLIETATINGVRNLDIEDEVSKHPALATRYAIQVIKGRWPKGEPAILTSPAWCVNYADQVLGQRWAPAEPIILNSEKGWIIKNYAIDVIKGRWILAEPILLRVGTLSDLFQYAKDVIKGRWPDAEPKFRANPDWWQRYKGWILDVYGIKDIGHNQDTIENDISTLLDVI